MMKREESDQEREPKRLQCNGHAGWMEALIEPHRDEPDQEGRAEGQMIFLSAAG